MAASILSSCGRVAAFKTTVLQVCGLRSLPSAVFLCTKPVGSKKDSKKNEGEIITNTKATVKLADEDLRKFLARKTLVTFPQRGKLPSLEGEPVFSSKRGLTKKLAEEDSSTSSSSDSSSDSEEEDDSFKESRKTQVYFPRRDHISSEDQTTKINVVSQKGFLREQVKRSEKLSYSPKIAETSIKQKHVHKPATDDKLLKPDLTRHATDQNLKERHLQISEFGTKIIKNQRARKVAHKPLEVSIPGAASSTLSRTQTMPQQNVVQNLTLLKKEGVLAKEKEGVLAKEKEGVLAKEKEGVLAKEKEGVMAKEKEGVMAKEKEGVMAKEKEGVMAKEKEGVMAKEVQKTEELQEPVLNARMPAVDPTVNEEMVLDAGDQTEQSTMQEIKPPVETVQETDDSSTYKNLQHHEYSPYTFVDHDVLLSKMRLPQPSSGRVSPRH